MLGNSHVACIKRGWDQISHLYDQTELVFFAKRGGYCRLVILNDDKSAFIPKTNRVRRQFAFTSQTSGDIVFDDYNFGLVIGHTEALRLPENAHFSNAVITAMAQKYSADNRAVGLLKILCAATKIPIFVGHEPLVAGFQPRIKLDYLAGIKFLNANVFQDLPATMLTQPDETIDGAFSTKAEYSINSKKLREPDSEQSELAHSAEDRGHMNTAYGSAFLRKFLGEINAV